MTKILGISGRKQSGKNTTCNFLYGMEMISLKMIEKFQMGDNGNLVVPSLIVEKGEEKIVWGEFDVTRIDDEFVGWAIDQLWPFIKDYSFADVLKRNVCIDILGLTHEQCYGTDQEKNTETHIHWRDLPTPNKNLKSKKMTAREVMQYVGTDFFRRIYPDVLADCGIKMALSHGSQLAIFTDVRFPNEVEAIQKNGGKVIRLTRVKSPEDKHESELALEKENYDWNNFDLVINNENLAVKDTNKIVYDALAEWGWVERDFVVNNVDIPKPMKVPAPTAQDGYVARARK